MVDTLILSVEGLMPDTVTLINPDGISDEGIPIFALDTRGFGPGGTLTQELVFANPARRRVTRKARGRRRTKQRVAALSK